MKQIKSQLNKSRTLHSALILFFITLFLGCGAPIPASSLATPTATPTAIQPTTLPPSTNTPVAQNSPIDAPNPKLTQELWLDPVTSLNWLLGGEGTIEMAMNFCYGDYRDASYSELYRAVLDGLAKTDKMTQIWTKTSAYFDPQTNQNLVYFINTSDATIVPANPNETKGLVCIYDPQNH